MKPFIMLDLATPTSGMSSMVLFLFSSFILLITFWCFYRNEARRYCYDEMEPLKEKDGLDIRRYFKETHGSSRGGDG